MKVVIKLFNEENVWVPVYGCKILTNITYIKSSDIKQVGEG